MKRDGSSEHAMLVLKFVRPDRGGILRRDDARNLLRRTLEYYTKTGRLRLYAWAILPSKVALLVAMPAPEPIVDTVSDIFGYYTRRLNNRYQHRGALFRTKFVKKIYNGPAGIGRAIARVHGMPHEREILLRPGAEPQSSEGVYRGELMDAITQRYAAPPLLTLPSDAIAV